MCSDPDSRPPIDPNPAAEVSGEHVRLVAADGNELTAYRADAADATGAGMVVLPDYYGLTPFYEALALRFAEHGVDAIAVDYYGRTASAPPRDREFDHVAHAGRTSWAGLRADVSAAAAALRTERGVSRLFSVGFCFGGRTSFLLGTVPELEMAGVIGFYGWPVGSFANDTPAPTSVAERIEVPLLGIFGGADTKITAADVREFESSLRRARAPHRVITYDGAPHSFFDRKQAGHDAAARAAWQEVRAFIGAAAT